jgi:GT2 family glycosyltransferase
MALGETNRQPLVSVIVIFLNAERFIREAVESVFAQSYEAWELLLVDDGSTDGSMAVARCYAEQYRHKVSYLAHAGHQNRGMSASRNLGLAAAKGEYIAFLDADDVWLPHKLAQQVETLAVLPEAVMVYGPAQWWYSWNGRLPAGQRDYIHELGVPANTLLQPPELLRRFLQNEGISPCTCSVLVRRQVALQVGGFEERFRGLYEDQAFFAKLSMAAPIFVSPDCSARYRQHIDSNCSKSQETETYRMARLAFLNWLAGYLSQQGFQDTEMWQTLQREKRLVQYPSLFRLVHRAGQGPPGQAYRWLREFRLRWRSLPLVRQLRCLQLRRLQPLGNGRQSGTPIVRYYWDNFLQQHQADIQGRALEIGTTHTIRRYGGQAVTDAEALDLTAHSPEITVVADLSRADHVPSNQYDCFVNQFTMHLIYNVEAALYHAVRILKPGGVLLINFPCVDYYFSKSLDMGTGMPFFLFWWFTPIQVENLLRQLGLSMADYSLRVYGNLFSRVAYQMNLPAEELTAHELAYEDAGHPLLICVRVVKPANWQAEKPIYREPWQPVVTPARWQPERGHYAA